MNEASYAPPPLSTVPTKGILKNKEEISPYVVGCGVDGRIANVSCSCRARCAAKTMNGEVAWDEMNILEHEAMAGKEYGTMKV